MELWLYSWFLWQRRGGTLAIFMALVPEKGGTLAILMALVPEKGGTLAIFMALVPEKGWYSGYIHGSVFHCKKKKKKLHPKWVTSVSCTTYTTSYLYHSVGF